MNIKNH